MPACSIIFTLALWLVTRPVMQKQFKYKRVSLSLKEKQGRLKRYKALHYQPRCTLPGAGSGVNAVFDLTEQQCDSGVLSRLSDSCEPGNTDPQHLSSHSTPGNCLFTSTLPSTCLLLSLLLFSSLLQLIISVKKLKGICENHNGFFVLYNMMYNIMML